MNKTIQYGFNRDGLYARCGDKIACTVLDFEHMKPENGFETQYSIESFPAYDVLSTTHGIIWTRKVSTAIKNIFRVHFGLKPLKDDGKEVLLGGMTHEQYLCHDARQCCKNAGHDMNRFKKVTSWGKVYYEAACKKCGREVLVNPKPAPNEVSICGEVFGYHCKEGGE